MIEVVPSIPTNNPEELNRAFEQTEGVTERISIDIIDGKFANNKTIDPSIVGDIETDLKIDFQLMVVEPINWVERCIRGQADRIIGHVEHMSDQIAFIGKVQEAGLLVGLGINMETPVGKIDKSLINSLDVVLLMSIDRVGFGGEKFDDAVFKKIQELNEIRKNDTTPFRIHIDGGVVPDKMDKLEKFGVDEVSIGTRIFAGDLAGNLANYK
jgi:ribulose-phosphate 3-epimerase